MKRSKQAHRKYSAQTSMKLYLRSHILLLNSSNQIASQAPKQVFGLRDMNMVSETREIFFPYCHGEMKHISVNLSIKKLIRAISGTFEIKYNFFLKFHIRFLYRPHRIGMMLVFCSLIYQRLCVGNLLATSCRRNNTRWFEDTRILNAIHGIWTLCSHEKM